MDLIITNTGEVPIYQQIVDQIKGAVLRGELAADEPLPSIRLLAKELQISVITTKRAYEELEKDGLIYTIPGKGSFVADQSERRLRESKQKLVEEKLAEAMKAAKLLGMSRAELREVFNRLLEGEKWDLF
ncbi:MAG TPA: GntR family transcriptional regulator [Firmicutes bacterium]|nr:GntR family transcriptional regulator [Bacillota bacterium]HHT42297.1 GntR family transcriptional regulator [Bacillota bacterium]